MSTRYLEALFNPASVAIIGASESAHNLGGMVLRNLMSGDYPGQLAVVNPHPYDCVHGVPCFKRISRLPFAPDLAVVCTPPETVPKLIRQLGERGVKTALVLTGGMSRTHSRSGRPLMYAVRDAARKTGIRVLGPNTIGIMVPEKQLNATYAHMGVLPGSIAFVGQSGAIASAVIDWAFARGIGFSHFLTLGDSMDIDHDDLIDYLAQDRGTRAILLHLENIPSPRRFISAVRVASRTKPVIAVKSGRVPESEWVPVALPDGVLHSDPIYDAVLSRAGVLRVNGLDEMFDAIESLSRLRPLRHQKLTIVANGVGPGVLAVDKLLALGGELTQLSAETLHALSQLLPPYWTHKNPIDLNYDAGPERYAQAVRILAQDPDVSNLLVLFAPTLTEDSVQIADALVHAVKDTRLNLLTCWLGQSTVADARDAFYAASIPTFFSPEKAVKAFMHHVRHQRSQRLLRETPESVDGITEERTRAREIIRKALKEKRDYLSNQEAREVLMDYAIAAETTFYCEQIDEVIETFRVHQQPVHLTLLHEKSCHPYLEERTGRARHRATLRYLNDEQALRDSCERLLQAHQQQFESSRVMGFALQLAHSHTGGVGFSLGITRDPQFGPLIVCGAGGASLNVMSDRQIALPPLNRVLARELLSRTYMYRLLKEFSVAPEQDIRSVCETLVILSQMLVDLPEIKGLEILPLLFNDQGAIAVDVAIDLAAPGQLIIHPYPRGLEETVVLRSGRQLVLRPVRAEDELAHQVFHQQQSMESIRYRFFQYRKRFSHEDIAQMVQIDYDREMVFIASTGNAGGEAQETLGAVRTFTDADNLQSEFAVMVHDQLKGEGLGQLLMQKMIRYCKQRGTVELVGTVLPDNEPMLKLARRLGFSVTYQSEEEVMVVKLSLNRPDDWQRERLRD